MQPEKLSFPGAAGVVLAARLDRPAGPVRAYALFAHCFTCTKDIFAASRIAGSLTDAGFAVLRFDFTGLGHSEGEFANTNFSSNVQDLIAAADYLRAAHQAPQLLIGHSLGGAAALAAAGAMPEVKGVVTIGAPSDPGHLEHLLSGAIDEIETAGEAEIVLAGRPFRVSRQFLDDIRGQTLTACVRNLDRALLVMHAPRDDTVAIDNAAAIFQAARHPKSFISLDDADHLLTRRRDGEYVAAVIAGWAGRYVEDGSAAAAPATAAEGEVVVAETGVGKYSQTVAAGRHRLRADEPHPIGDDTGPTPYDLLLAGLGACTSMTLRMYATRKGLPLERVVVHLRHAKIHAEDCAACETTAGKIDRIDRTIEVHGALDEAQRAKLLEIADKCPVHRTLRNENLIVSALAEPG